MIFDLIRDGLTTDLIVHLCVRVFTIFCVLPIHEYAHALVAYALGDKTAKEKGRLKLNPLAHIDPTGALMMILVGFGYAKPVPVNMFRFKPEKRKLYMGLTALAGPLSNILLAFISTLIYALIYVNTPTSSISNIIVTFFAYSSSINVSLAVFNLLPVPPLDGSRMVSIIVPDKYYYKIMAYERYIVLAVFALLFLGILDKPITVLSSALQNLISTAVFAIIH